MIFSLINYSCLTKLKQICQWISPTPDLPICFTTSHKLNSYSFSSVPKHLQFYKSPGRLRWHFQRVDVTWRGPVYVTEYLHNLDRSPFNLITNCWWPGCLETWFLRRKFLTYAKVVGNRSLSNGRLRYSRAIFIEVDHLQWHQSWQRFIKVVI